MAQNTAKKPTDLIFSRLWKPSASAPQTTETTSSSRRKLLWFGVLALLLHVGAVRVMPKQVARVATRPVASTETSLEEVELASPEPTAAPPEQDSPLPNNNTESKPRPKPLGMVRLSGVPSVEVPSALDPTMSPAPTGDGYRFNPFQAAQASTIQPTSVQGARIVVPGLADAVVVQEPSPDATPKGNNVNKMLRDGLAAKDAERAIYRGQPMVLLMLARVGSRLPFTEMVA
jgi:hypothetical protein